MQLRWAAILPILTFAGALILSFLCVYAGSRPGFLESYDLLQVNTSRIAVNISLFERHNDTASPSTCKSGIFCSLKNNITSEIHNLTSEIEENIESALNNRLESIARDLGLHDFYSFHVLDHCEGFFSPNGTANRNVTRCSGQAGLTSFNLSQELQSELSSHSVNITLPQLHWPQALDDGLHALRNAFRAVFVLYIVSIILVGLTLVGSLAGLPLTGRIVAFANVGTGGLAWLVLMVTSIVVTVAMDKATDVVNEHGSAINVNATRGAAFLALTWAAFALAFCGWIVWASEMVLGRRKLKKMPKKYDI